MKTFGHWLSQIKNADSAIADLQQDFAWECASSGKKPSNFLSPFHLLSSILAHDGCSKCIETLDRAGSLFFSEESIVKAGNNLFFTPAAHNSWMSGEGLFFQPPEKIRFIDRSNNTKGATTAVRFHLIMKHDSSFVSCDRRWDETDSPWLYLNGLAVQANSEHLDLYRIPRDSSLLKSPSRGIKQWSYQVSPVTECQASTRNHCLYAINQDCLDDGELPSFSFWQHFSLDDHIEWEMPTPVVYYSSVQQIGYDVGFVTLNMHRIKQMVSKGLTFSFKSCRRGRKSLSVRTRRKVMERDRFQCVDCGRSPQNDPSCVLHIDHRLPVSKGGTDAMDNLQTLCDWCNLGKKTDLDWKLNQSC